MVNHTTQPSVSLTPFGAQSSQLPHTASTTPPSSTRHQILTGPLPLTAAVVPGSTRDLMQGLPPVVLAHATAAIRPAAAASDGATMPAAAAAPAQQQGRVQPPVPGQAVQAGRNQRSDAASAAAGLPAPARPTTASNVIAAAARANAAAASAIAQSGTLTNPSLGVGHNGRQMSQAPVKVVSKPSGRLPAMPAASLKAAQTGVSPGSIPGAPQTGPGTSGPFPAGRPGLEVGQGHAIAAAPASSASSYMTQQQRLNGLAMMNAMQLPHESDAQSVAHGPAQAVADRLRLNSQPSMTAQQQTAAALGASPRFGSMQGPKPYINHNFSLPSGPVPSRASSNPSFRAASATKAGLATNSSIVSSSSSALNTGWPASSAVDGAGENPTHPGGSSIPLLVGSPPPASGLPHTASGNSLGSQAAGTPTSPGYRPQGLPSSNTQQQTMGQVLPAASHLTSHMVCAWDFASSLYYARTART